MTWKSLNVCQVGNCFADFRDKTSKLSKVKSCNKTTFILRAFHWSSMTPKGSNLDLGSIWIDGGPDKPF